MPFKQYVSYDGCEVGKQRSFNAKEEMTWPATKCAGTVISLAMLVP